MLIVVEQLSISSFFKTYFLIKKYNINVNNINFYYVFLDKYFIIFKRIIEYFMPFNFILFDFKFDSLKDKNGIHAGWNVWYKDLNVFLEIVDGESLFNNSYKNYIDKHTFQLVLKKRIFQEKMSRTGLTYFIELFILIQAIHKLLLKEEEKTDNIVLFEMKAWRKDIIKYGKIYNINIFIKKYDFIFQLTQIIKNIRVLKLIKNKINMHCIKQKFNFEYNSCTSVIFDIEPKLFPAKLFAFSKNIPSYKVFYVSDSVPVSQEDLNEIRASKMDFISLNKNVSFC